ncbi:response regulator transcription factor, partial [Palleronia abyssalis]|uniref:response regulator transcription factor n=1 Tax=Palleronia abyssalis TaxID=1501240 RepID=UPI001C633482
QLYQLMREARLTLAANARPEAGRNGLTLPQAHRGAVPVNNAGFSQANLVKLIDRGIRGYQPETVSSSVLEATLQLVALGEIALPSVLAEHLAGIPRDIALVPLSAKELVVMRCLARGFGNKEISRSVGIAEATTKVHVKAIMRKLGVSNRTQAAVWAVRNGLDQSFYTNR